MLAAIYTFIIKLTNSTFLFAAFKISRINNCCFTFNTINPAPDISNTRSPVGLDFHFPFGAGFFCLDIKIINLYMRLHQLTSYLCHRQQHNQMQKLRTRRLPRGNASPLKRQR